MKRFLWAFNVVATALAVWLTILIVGYLRSAPPPALPPPVAPGGDEVAAGETLRSAPLPEALARTVWERNLFSPARKFEEPVAAPADKREPDKAEGTPAAPEGYELVGVSLIAGQSRAAILVTPQGGAAPPRSQSRPPGRPPMPGPGFPGATPAAAPAAEPAKQRVEVHAVNETVGHLGYKLLAIALDQVTLHRPEGTPTDLVLALNRGDESSQKRNAERQKEVTRQREQEKKDRDRMQAALARRPDLARQPGASARPGLPRVGATPPTVSPTTPSATRPPSLLSRRPTAHGWSAVTTPTEPETAPPAPTPQPADPNTNDNPGSWGAVPAPPSPPAWPER